MSTHAILSPSGAHRWARCPGSVALEEGQPDSSSSYARWGTAAHEVASMCMVGAATVLDAESFVGRRIEADGEMIDVDMEMADCVNDYVAQVEAIVGEKPVWFGVERAVQLQQITGEKDATGTADVMALVDTPTGLELIVIDLKTGRGVLVDAENNEQLDMYAGGALEELDLLYDISAVRKVIIQPRLGNISEELLTVYELRERLHALSQAASKADNSCLEKRAGGSGYLSEAWQDTYLAPGEKQCQFCKAKAFCPALGKEVSNALAGTAANPQDFPDLSLPKQAAAAVDKDAIAGLEPERLAEAMRAVPLIELWMSAVRGAVEARLFEGKDVPGYYLGVGKRGNRAWSSASAAEELMRKAKVKADEMYSKSLISVTTAEKLFKERKSLWPKLAGLITQSDGKPSVCKDGDKNAPYKIGADPEDFPVVEDDPLA